MARRCRSSRRRKATLRRVGRAKRNPPMQTMMGFAALYPSYEFSVLHVVQGGPHPEELAKQASRRMATTSVSGILLVRDGARAPPHHEDENHRGGNQKNVRQIRRTQRP